MFKNDIIHCKAETSNAFIIRQTSSTQNKQGAGEEAGLYQHRGFIHLEDLIYRLKPGTLKHLKM